jgi:hypothetical protein
MTAAPTPPPGLGKAGAQLWDAITGDVPEGNELDARELATLEHAARIADAIDALEGIVAAQGYLATGVAKQVVVHPAVTEARQQRATLHRLLASIGLEATDAYSPTQRRAQRAAAARWGRRDALREATA